jgi:hypothetical protein
MNGFLLFGVGEVTPEEGGLVGAAGKAAKTGVEGPLLPPDACLARKGFVSEFEEVDFGTLTAGAGSSNGESSATNGFMLATPRRVMKKGACEVEGIQVDGMWCLPVTAGLVAVAIFGWV